MNAAAQPSCSCLLSLEAAEETFDQQREPKHSQAAEDTQTSFVGAEDVWTNGASSDGNTAADKTAAENGSDQVKQEEIQTGVKILESTEEMTAVPEITVMENQPEPQTTEGSEPEPNDPSERTGSAPEAATGDEMSQTVNKHVCDSDVEDADPKDGRASSEVLRKADEQWKLKEREEETIKEVTEEGNQEHSFSAEPEADSRIIPSNQPESFITSRKDIKAEKCKSRSPVHLKVLQAG